MTIDISTPRAFEPTYNVPANIHIEHPQLRDLIICPERGQIAYATNGGLATRSVTNKHEHERHLPDIGFAPTCVASGSGLIAAGGQRTEIYIAPISSLASAPERGAWELSTSFRGSINNSIFITNLTLSTNPYASTYDDLQYMSSVNPRLFVSNNDQSLRVFNIATNLVCSDTGKSIARLSKAGAVELKTCVNHSSLSPDGRTMVVVGDTDEVFLFDVRGGDTVTFEPIAVYKGAEDAGFSTAWSSDGLKFAVASQCGSAMIWDIRSSIPAAKFSSQEAIKRKRHTPTSRYTIGADGGHYWTPPPQPLLRSYPASHSHENTHQIVSTGVRSIKFSPKCAALGDDGREILVFTEHMNNVHIVDAKTFNTHTVIRVPPLPPPPSSLALTVGSAPMIPEKSLSDNIHRRGAAERFDSAFPGDAPWCTPSSSAPASPLHRTSNILPSVHDEGGLLEYAFMDDEADAMLRTRRTMMFDADEEVRLRYHDDDDGDDDSIHTIHRRRRSLSPSYETALSMHVAPEPTTSEFDRRKRCHHLSGLCFDPTGRFMYVGTEHNVVEWDVGSRRWDGGDHGRVWEGSEWA